MIRKATSTDPELALRQQDLFHGVWWDMSFEEAQEKAQQDDRPILIDFTGVNCPNCRQMEEDVFVRDEVIQRMKQFVTVALYVDRVPIPTITSEQRESLADAFFNMELELSGEATQPLYLTMMPDGQVLEVVGGSMSARQFNAFLDRSLALFAETNGQSSDVASR